MGIVTSTHSYTFQFKLQKCTGSNYQIVLLKKTLEKTEGAIKYGQSRETGNIGYTRHKTKANKTKNTTQNTKIDEQHGPHQKPRVNPGAREGSAVPTSYKTRPCYSLSQDMLDTTIRNQTQIPAALLHTTGVTTNRTESNKQKINP